MWDRIRSNPGVWGMVLGGAVGFFGMYLRVLKLTGQAGSTSIRAISTSIGTTLFFGAILAMIAGAGVAVTSGRGWRIFWSIVGFLMGLELAAFGLYCIFSPQDAATRIANADAYQAATGLGTTTVSESFKTAFAANTLSASWAIGAVVVTLAGLLILIGAIFSFTWKYKAAER
ncbi:MAG TPA: hypothetical protein VK646_04500 [Actinomycetota bacterium]|nr:hypothetical protein [Actinomycetota bacterium]